MATPSTSAASVKSEALDPLDLESTIVGLVSQHPDGLSNKQLETEVQVDKSQRMQAINRLLSTGKLQMHRQPGVAGFILKVNDQANVQKIQGATTEETVVYEIIGQAGVNSIWVRDIVRQSGLPQQVVNKTLKALENRKLIKSIKALNQPRKKLYMLYELTADEKITGGAFYSDQEFDEAFVRHLSDHCLKLLKSRAELAGYKHSASLSAAKLASFVSTSEVHAHITDSRISNVPLKQQDIECVLDTLVYDGLCERQANTSAGQGDAATKYAYVKPFNIQPGMSVVPCAFCPVADDCRPAGTINPAGCQYLTDWLDEAAQAKQHTG